MSDAQRDELPNLVAHPVALGYWGTVDGHSGGMVGEGDTAVGVRVVEDRSLADIWNFWVVRLLNDFLENAMGKERVGRFESFGADWFMDTARQAGLRPPVRRTFGARALGMLYARAGMVLRIAQSDQVSDEGFGGHHWVDLTNYWPYDEDPPATVGGLPSTGPQGRKKRRQSSRPPGAQG